MTKNTARTAGLRLGVHQLGLRDYAATLAEMQQFTAARDAATADECWILEHPSVFTLGIAAREVRPYKNPQQIPVVQSDRGGQITYHGPGQLIIYLLLDLRRCGWRVKELVYKSEELIIGYLASYGISAGRRPSMPGVYVKERKIASLGYRIRRGCCYHGISVNLTADLRPFSWIDVCGYEGLEVINLADLVAGVTTAKVTAELALRVGGAFNYPSVSVY